MAYDSSLVEAERQRKKKEEEERQQAIAELTRQIDGVKLEITNLNEKKVQYVTLKRGIQTAIEMLSTAKQNLSSAVSNLTEGYSGSGDFVSVQTATQDAQEEIGGISSNLESYSYKADEQIRKIDKEILILEDKLKNLEAQLAAL